MEVWTRTDRSLCVGHDFSRFFTLALELSCQSDLGCPQPEIFNIERGYLSIELLDTDTKCRIKSTIKVRSAFKILHIGHYALRNMFIGEEKFLLDWNRWPQNVKPWQKWNTTVTHSFRTQIGHHAASLRPSMHATPSCSWLSPADCLETKRELGTLNNKQLITWVPWTLFSLSLSFYFCICTSSST